MICCFTLLRNFNLRCQQTVLHSISHSWNLPLYLPNTVSLYTATNRLKDCINYNKETAFAGTLFALAETTRSAVAPGIYLLLQYLLFHAEVQTNTTYARAFVLAIMPTVMF